MSLDDDDPVDLDFPIVRLRALYDYSYKDDEGHVITMKQGDEYHLISKSGDWWEVIRDAGGANEFTFYVPASYVQIIDEDNEKNSPHSSITKESNSDNNNEKYDQDDILVTGSEHVKSDMAYTARSTTNYVNQNEVGITFGKGKSFKKKSESSIPSATIAVPAVQVPYRRSYSDDGDYVNLDKYRTDADVEVNDEGESTDSVLHTEAGSFKKDYANIAAIQQSKHDLPSPDVAKCDFIKTLLDVWDMFHDPETNRLFYINKDTNERTWKPPRHPNKHERAQQVVKLDTKVNRTGGILPEIKVDQTLTNIPEGWTVEETKEGTVYLNENNEDRWMSSINAEEVRYFYKVGSTETAWNLPKTNRKSNGDVAMELPSPQTSPSAPRTRSPQIGRSMKAKSMFIESNLSFQHPPHLPTSPPPRAQTLPNNLNTQAGGEANVEKAIFTPQQEPFAGTVCRAKIYEAHRKIKKTWVNCYAKLSGSNLVFYKDMKSSKSVPGSPFGKSELIIPLQGCMVSKASKEISSKRNVIALSTSHGDQHLVQVDDDKSARKLLIQLEIKINEVQGEVFPSRGPSVSSAENTIEKSSTNSLTERLNMFFKIRPKKESLEQHGIIKYPVIGGELKMICEKEKTRIPKFVLKCVTAIESRGLDHDGIYRISGNLAHIQKLRCQVDQDTYNLDSKEWDVFILTGTLKLFFRELKEPLLTFELFDKLVLALMKGSNAERLKSFRENIHNLPKYNFETFKFLCTHLLKVCELSKENRMEVQNIAIVFGPTLIWPQNETNQAIGTNVVYESKIVEYCLLESKAIFR